MRLGWATPWNQNSAIGRGNAAVADVLAARGHEVEVIRLEQTPPDNVLPTDLAAPHWSELDLASLKGRHDALFVHFGDNYPFHAGGLPLIGAAPAVGVFHDLCVYNYFRGWCAQQPDFAAAHDGEAVATYGEAVRPFCEAARAGQYDLGAIVARTPMVEWIARHCSAGLVHARHYAGRVEASCAGPVSIAALPWPPQDVPPLRRREPRRLVALTVGMMNRNKCAEEVIRAIAGSPALKHALAYHLVGYIHDEERARLEALAQMLGYDGLRIFGALDAAGLEERLREADIICCLRRPILEGASGSVIEAMQSGRPTIVADAGCYGDIPDDLVMKTPAEVPVDAVRKALEALAADEPKRRDMGARAARWAKQEFTAERYADAVEALAQAAIDAEPVLHLAAHLGGELAALGLTRDDPAAGRLAARLGPVLASR